MKNSSLLILTIILTCIVSISQEEPTRLAVTFYGENARGYPADYPASVRERATSLRPGESQLMTPQEYRAYHAQKQEQYKDTLRALHEAQERPAPDPVGTEVRAATLFILREIEKAAPGYRAPSRAQIKTAIRTIMETGDAD